MTSEIGNSVRPPLLSSDDDEASNSNLFMRETCCKDENEQNLERAITPISNRDPETGLMDKTLDQYIEDLREANK